MWNGDGRKNLEKGNLFSFLMVGVMSSKYKGDVVKGAESI